MVKDVIEYNNVNLNVGLLYSLDILQFYEEHFKSYDDNNNNIVHEKLQKLYIF